VPESVCLLAAQVTVTNKTVQFGSQPAWRCLDSVPQHHFTSAITDDVTRRPVAMFFHSTGCRPVMLYFLIFF